MTSRKRGSGVACEAKRVAAAREDVLLAEAEVGRFAGAQQRGLDDAHDTRHTACAKDEVVCL